MAETSRMTIYLDPAIHRALKMKAAATNQKMSAVVDQALRALLAEDMEDLDALKERADEQSRPFEDFLKELKEAGQI